MHTTVQINIVGIGGTTKGTEVVFIWATIESWLCSFCSILIGDVNASIDGRHPRNWIGCIYTKAVRQSGMRRHQFAMKYYFLVHRWTRDDIQLALFIKQEMKTADRKFSRHTVAALKMLLCCADGSRADAQTAEISQNIGYNWRVRKEVSSGPRRFKWKLGTQELKFNHSVHVNLVYTGRQPMIYRLDEATHFCSAL